MPRDPYETLGIQRSATADEITKAYRQLARKYHPDRNPGDKEAEAKFKEIQNAYDILNDPAKRSNFDRFGSPEGAKGSGFGGFSGFSGAPDDMMQEILRQFAGGGGPGGFSFDFGAPSAGPRGRSRQRQAPAEEIERDITIPFMTAALGGKIDLNIDDQVVGVTIPAGAKEGQALRLKGLLPGGANLKLKLHVEPHPHFRRDGDDLLIDVPLSLSEALLGAKVDVPLLAGGTAAVSFPPGSSSGAKLRLKGQGIAGGDMYAVVKVVVPKKVDDRSKELIEEFARLNPQQPRADGPWKS